MTEQSQTPEAAVQSNTETAATDTLLGGTPDGNDTAHGSASTQESGSNTEQDTKPEGEKADGEGASSEAPEQYDLKMPEGVTVDPERMTEFASIAKEIGLTNEQAQKLADLSATWSETDVKAAEAARDKQLNEMQDAWKEEFKKDPKHQEILVMAKRAVNRLAPEGDESMSQVRGLLQGSWLANHPGMIRMLAKVGALLSEDKFLDGGPGGSSTKSMASVMYNKN